MRALTDGGALAERDVRGKILVLRSERVGYPRTERREPGEAAAGDEGELRGRMIDPVGGHRAHKGRLIDHLLEVGKQVGDHAAGLGALLELPRARHDLLRAVERAALDLEGR